DVSVSQVMGAVGWVLGHAGRGLAGGGRALGRLVMAMFPEKSERERARLADDEDLAALDGLDAADERASDEDASEDEEDEDEEDTLATPAHALPPINGMGAPNHERTIQGMPVAPVVAAMADAAVTEAVPM